MIELFEPGSTYPYRFQKTQAKEAYAQYKMLTFNGARIWIYIDHERVDVAQLKELAQ